MYYICALQCFFRRCLDTKDKILDDKDDKDDTMDKILDDKDKSQMGSEAMLVELAQKLSSITDWYKRESLAVIKCCQKNSEDVLYGVKKCPREGSGWK